MDNFRQGFAAVLSTADGAHALVLRAAYAARANAASFHGYGLFLRALRHLGALSPIGSLRCAQCAEAFSFFSRLGFHFLLFVHWPWCIISAVMPA